MGEAAPFGRGRIRRLFGLDRTGAEPEPTRAGQPLRPFTLPNLVGYARIAGLVVFWVVAMGGDGRDPVLALIYFVVAAGDYVDGLLARVTGQYSRLGALMDPVIDRLTVLSGALVCWHFSLLPRWLLALLIVRELVTILLARWGLARGLDIEVNWIGRSAVLPVMASLLLAMLMTGPLPAVLLAVGVVLAFGATLLYYRTGRDRLRARTAEPDQP